jgi:adenylate cyclase
MFKLLIIRPDGKEIEQEFNGDQTIIGRHEKCELRLVDGMVSRNHSMILREGKRFLIKDLDSRNGTWVNGRRIKNRRHVKAGDVFQVGPFRIIFEPDLHEGGNDRLRVGPMETTTDLPAFMRKHETETVLKPLGMISNYLSETSGQERRSPTRVRRERLNRNLLTLYRITEELVVRKDLDEMLNYIMDQIFEIYTPSQATILLKDKHELPIPSKQRSADEKGNIRPISNTIVNRVLNDRVAMLTDNASEDPRFEMGESVIIDGIRSVMAAPIWEDRSILGVLYVDSLDVVAGYQTEDLDLLTAIGHQAALAIQRWKLTERLREEAVKNAVIRQNLSRFHSAQVVDLILKGAADLEVKETVATIFFCDIVSFTSLCESGTPQQLQEILNLFCSIVNQIVFNEQGTLDKFLGDGALAIFGAPLPQADAPIRAVRAAIRIRDLLKRTVSSLAPELRFKVRYGINTGQAIVGNFGSAERMDYTILGHTVNLAARISENAEPDQILIGPDTFEQIRDKGLFTIDKAGSRALKGLKSKMKLYEVKGLLI